jgi:hypothetical protein
LIAVDFVAQALIKASEAPHWPGPINIASGQGTRLTDLAAWVLALTASSSKTVVLPARSEEVVGFIADVSAMKTHLGLQPPEPLQLLPGMVALNPTTYASAG